MLGFLFLLLAPAAALTALVLRRRAQPRESTIAAITAAIAAALAWALRPSFLLLRKMVALAVMPTVILWLALATLTWTTRRTPRTRWLALAVLLAYTLLSVGWPAGHLIVWLEAPYVGIDPLAGNVHYDAILLLGGGSTSAPSGTPQLSVRGDRIRLAAALVNSGRTERLLTSGTTLSGRDTTIATRALLEQLGVPTGLVETIPKPLNTAQEIAALQALVRERGWQRVGVVSSARHLRRVEAIARARGLVVEPLPADFRGPSLHPDRGASSFYFRLPNARALETLEEALWELMGLAIVPILGG